MKLYVCGSGSNGNTMILTENSKSIILDAGIKTSDVKRALNYDVLSIQFVIITHGHQDHARYINDYLNMGITVYMLPEMKENYSQNNAVGLKERAKIKDGDFYITPFHVPHDETPNYAYIIGIGEHKIAYLTDLEYCPYILKSQNLTEILCECNYQKELVDKDSPNYSHKLRGHMSLDCCKSFIQANKTNALRNVILCHLGTETTIAEECVTEVQKVAGGASVSVAEAGKSWELSLYPF